MVKGSLNGAGAKLKWGVALTPQATVAITPTMAPLSGEWHPKTKV